MGVNGIYGLSGSGIDIESMVKVGMMGRQKEYDKLQQAYTKNEWQKQAYNEVYSSIQTFNNSTLTQYKLQSNMNAKKASTTSNAVSVEANGSAPILNHKVQVKSLSSSAVLTSTASLTRYDSEYNTTTQDQTSVNLADVLFKGLQKNVSTGSTMANVHNIGDDSTDTNLHKLSETAFALQISDGSKDANGNLKYSTIKYTYNQLLNGTTMSDLASDINALGTNVRASYDSVNDSFSFYNKEGGSDNGVFFKIPTKTTTNEDGESVTTATDAGNVAKQFLQNLQLFQSKDGTLLDQNGNDVTEATERTNYFGYNSKSSVDAPASLVASNVLTDSEGNIFGGNNLMSDVLFKKFEYEATGDTDDNGYPTYNAKYSDYDYTGTEEFQNVIPETETALSFTLNGEDFTYNFDELGSQSVDTFFNDIYTRTGLVASISDEGYFSISSEETGSNQSISITTNNEITNKFFNRLGLTDATDEAAQAISFSEGEEVTTKGTDKSEGMSFGLSGTNGVAVIDGVTYDNITNNKVTASGVTYTLLETTETAQTVNVTQDTDGIIDKVKSFVEDYNKLLSSLYEKYDEKQYKDYKPLTESQKEQMKDEQIEKWEEKAKSGMLYHDQTLSKLIYDMRDAVSTPVDGISGKYNSVFSLGISTTGLKGQLTLNVDKLRAALTEDPDAVYNVFGKLDNNDNSDGNGVAQRLGDVFTNNMKSIRSRAGINDSINDDSDLGQLMRNLQSKMSDFKKLMSSFEDKLYKKYDAMEVALSRLGMQLSYLTGGQ